MKKLIFVIFIVLTMAMSALVGCNSESGETTLQAKYDHAINELSRYMSVDVAWNDNKEALFGNEAALYLYNEFKELGNYKDSADYFNRFLVLDNALTKITTSEIDAFGNVCEDVYKKYEYSSYGECPDLCELFDLIGLINVVDDGYKYEYAENGKITTIHTFEYGEQVLRASLVYDEKGNIVEVTYLTKDNESYSNRYIYNENNKLISVDKNIMSSMLTPMGYWDCHISAEYTYDTQGRISVVQEILTDRRNKQYTYEITYSYDSNGNISEEHRLGESKVYAYNDNGDISSVQVTKEGTSYTYVYHYETLYIYQSHK